jgi:uncharacterized protein (DUF302 family)
MSENETTQSETSENEEQARVQYGRHMLWLSGIVGAVLGAVLCAALIFYVVLPARLILTYESRAGFDETVAALQRSIPDSGWAVSSVTDVCGTAVDPNNSVRPRVTLVSMCKPEYAEIVLRTDPAVAAMMPCTFAVWEGKDDKVYVSKTNMSLMARLFGGNVADVMGRRVAWDERIILGDIVQDD